jgi:hypothetical protein
MHHTHPEEEVAVAAVVATQTMVGEVCGRTREVGCSPVVSDQRAAPLVTLASANKGALLGDVKSRSTDSGSTLECSPQSMTRQLYGAQVFEQNCAAPPPMRPFYRCVASCCSD